MSENLMNGEDAGVKESVFNPEKQHEQPFDELAVTLSGGGYRAAAFHLGVLDMLNRLGLLQSVRVLSTVSGGTFTGMKYALSVIEGVPFAEFYTGFRDFIARTNVIGDALDEFQDRPGTPFTGQMPSLIRGAAKTLAEPDLFGDKRFDTLLDNETSHLKEVSFNATEFSSGNYFRFQRSKSVGAVIGNRNFKVNREVAGLMRLADIAAASSCFPGAFEPIRFPDDFLWPLDLKEVRQALGPNFKSCVALMDGGIYDNQGVDSVIQTYKRRGNKVGLIIVSDTNQRSPVSDTGPQGARAEARRQQRRDPLFDFAPEKRRGHLKLGTIFKLAWVALFLAVLSSAALVAAWVRSASARAAEPGGYRTGDFLLDILLYGFPLLLTVVVAVALLWLRRRSEEGQASVAELTTIELWPYVKTLTVSELIYLISGRVKSTLALTSSVFMKRIRELIYRNIKVYPKYQCREISNLIYDMDDTGKFKNEVVAKLKPEELSALAREAEGVATALWLKGPEDLKNLIACGQATTCFNVMRYILDCRTDDTLTPKPGSREAEIYDLAAPLWQQLKENRYALLR